ncbi:response regulator [bacterium]|nr:response regulator [bacterium]
MVDILIVDDEEEIRVLFYRYLTQLGYEVLWAENGKQASVLFDRYKPPVTVLDLSMPVMDGIEFLKSLDPGLLVSHGIIIMTGNDENSDIETCFKLGVQSFLKKPVNLFELEGNIKRSLDMYKAVSEIKQLNHRLTMRQQDFPNFLWECNKDLQLTYLDDNFTRMIGSPVDSLMGKPFRSLLAAKDVEQFQYKFLDEHHQPKEKIKGLTLDFETRDGQLLALQVFADAHIDNDGKIVGMVGICRDMSIFEQLSGDTVDTEEERVIRINNQFRLIQADAEIKEYLAESGIEADSQPDFLQFLDDPSLEQLLSYSFAQKENIPFPIEIRFIGKNEKEHRFSVQLHFDREGPSLQGQLVPIMAGDQ